MTRATVGVAALVLALPSLATAQTELPQSGTGTVTISAQDIEHTGHRLTDGTYIDNGRSRSGAMVVDAEYGVAERVAVGVSVPFVWARYTDDVAPPPPIPFLPRDQCRCWTKALQDIAVSARFKWIDTFDHVAIVAPSVELSVPSHRYAYQGEAVVGRRLTELRMGADASYRVDALTRGLTIGGNYMYAMVQHDIGYSTNRSNMGVGLDYQIGSRWSVGTSMSWQRTHGGIRVGSLPPAAFEVPGDLTTPERIAEHDRLLRDNWRHIGTRMSYRLGSSNLFAAFTYFAAGTDAHAGHGFIVGFTRPFRLRR